MNLPEEYQRGKFVILPIGYEKDLTYGDGASLGPAEIIAASKHLEYYDEQFDCEPFEKGIELLESVKATEPEEMIESVSREINKHKDKFIIGLGGDHSVTLGLTKNLDKDTSVIILDAHADFRDSWNGSSLNHACVAKQISKNHRVALLGIRSMDIDEKKQIEENEKVHLLKAYDFTLEKLREVLPKLKDKIYISIDTDVFDPSFIRNTGTPEPGGFNWNQVIVILREIFENKEVVGADIVEFAPKENFESDAYALAKLVYKIMALKQKSL
ncbi:agmatinase [Candidatus Woesearchaeota archaeon]|nr:agmatinase [Candidatus Woesearchaeota archaeon]